jgi:MarR-like DNA-binding transcriptional regulator SgrR of sgrS sRNA
MMRFSLLLLAVNSLLWSAAAFAAERPHYGGTLRIEVRDTWQSLDPVALTSAASKSLSLTVFETLVALDGRGSPQPLLASSWTSEPGNQRWRFQLRSGVSFSDGIPLDAAAVVASLRNSNSEWKVVAAGGSVIIETETPDLFLPATLAEARHGIVRRNNGGLIGTGPFVIREWTIGKNLTLAANDLYWAGRPFVDVISVDIGKNDREQIIMLDLGKVDVVQVAAENIHRTQADNREVMTSRPAELMALVFASAPQSDDEIHMRNALAMSIDRTALNDVVMQGGGEPASALLPTWMSGYGFVFRDSQSAGARLQTPSKRNQAWTLSFDNSDSVARVIAQRLALNAHDAGITLDASGAANGAANNDLRLVRIPLTSSDPHIALTELANVLQLPRPKFNDSSVADLYAAEKNLLDSHRLIPLLHLRVALALRPGIHDMSSSPDGNWRLQNAWLAAEKP